MKRLIILMLAALTLSSCLTQRKREDITYRYLREHPVTLAELCAATYPIRETVIRGHTVQLPANTIWLKPDSVPCPDGTMVYPDPVPCDCPGGTIRVDTVVRENTAGLDALAIRNMDLKVSLSSVEAQAGIYKRQSIRKTWWIAGLSALCLLIGFVRVKNPLSWFKKQ